MLNNIPVELQRLDQWVCAGPDKLPLNPRTGKSADVTDPSTWGTFEQAKQCGYKHIGFVLSKDDPYSIIDLDDPITEEQTERHSAIVRAIKSYSELSQSGKGLHIIVRGKIPKGCRRDKVEVYSESRYMICTGNVFNAFPITEQQPVLDQMYSQMQAAAPTVDLVQVDGSKSDEEIFTTARHAANGHKFETLWGAVGLMGPGGAWVGTAEWPSQSEADFALLSIIAFYTKDNEQVRRLFRFSALGKRDKAVRNNKYIDFALSKIRGKEVPPVDLTALLNFTSKFLNHENNTSNQTAQSETGDRSQNGSAGPSNHHTTTQESERSGRSTDTEITEPDLKTVGENGGVDKTATYSISFPPGFIGELAQYIYSTAIRPVPEIGLAAAIALTAGVVGRSYNVSGTGLNQYLIILAKTGSGKEGAATGIDAMVQAVRMQIPTVDDFIGPGAFASGQALIRVLDKQPCFVSILGEFGLTLQQLCDPKANSASVILKKVLLDIYAKSGFTKILRSSVYSEAEKNTKVVQAPNVTILGEATPESFYDGLDATAIAQGLIPRFSIFEYDGPRPPRNLHAFAPPPKELVDQFAALLSISLQCQQARVHCPVSIDPLGQEQFDDFDTYCDEQINSAQNDITLQLWNRAHLKALKLAALVAVGINPHQPVITAECCEWATDLIGADIRKIVNKFSSGDVGQGDTRLEADVKRAVMDFLRMSPRKRGEYATPVNIANQPIVPLGYLRRRLRNLASFRSDRRGSNAALAAALKSLVDASELTQIPPVQAKEQFKVASPLYCLGEGWVDLKG